MSALTCDVTVERADRGVAAPFRLRASFSAGPGITVVFGRSGSGKSTLLAALVGALRPTEGTIALGDRVLFDRANGVDVPIRRREIGMVFQEAALFPHLDVTANVAFGVRDRARRDDAAQRALERVGAGHLARRDPAGLSGGERQRVALARAWAADPAALLLDEPFSALDRGARSGLGGALVDLARTGARPVVHVTHEFTEAVRLGDRMIVLDDGEVVERGDPASIALERGSPASRDALGTLNVFVGTAVDHDAAAGSSRVDLGGVVVECGALDTPRGARVVLRLPGEDVLVCREPPGPTSARNVVPGRVAAIDRSRDARRVLTVETPVPFRVVLTPASVGRLSLGVGSDVHLLVKAASFRAES